MLHHYITKVFPAHAGVIRRVAHVGLVTKGFPRTRGGDPPPSFSASGTELFSPHTRG